MSDHDTHDHTGVTGVPAAATTVKLDDLATPDDNTDLNATTGRHGLLPKLGGGTTNFLRADGTWNAPAGGSSSFVGCRVYNSSAVALSNGSETEITFNSERYDTDAFHDTGSNTGRLTIPSGKAGKYHVGANVRVTGSPGDPCYVLIQHVASGPTTTTIALTFVPNHNTIPATNLSAEWNCSVGDYFRLYVFVNAGSKNATADSAYSPEFWLHYLGA